MHDNYRNRQNVVKEDAPETTPIDAEETVVETSEAAVPDMPINTEPEVPEQINTMAVVVNCTRLNIREKANKTAPVAAIIKAGDEVIVDLKNSTDAFYKVCNTAGVEGFCVKQYISIRP